MKARLTVTGDDRFARALRRRLRRVGRPRIENLSLRPRGSVRRMNVAAAFEAEAQEPPPAIGDDGLLQALRSGKR